MWFGTFNKWNGRPANAPERDGPGGLVHVFARDRLGFAADEKQAAVLDSTAKRGILNCTRQWGKSTVLAAKAVHRAWTEAGKPGAGGESYGAAERGVFA